MFCLLTNMVYIRLENVNKEIFGSQYRPLLLSLFLVPVFFSSLLLMLLLQFLQWEELFAQLGNPATYFITFLSLVAILIKHRLARDVTKLEKAKKRIREEIIANLLGKGRFHTLGFDLCIILTNQGIGGLKEDEALRRRIGRQLLHYMLWNILSYFLLFSVFYLAWSYYPIEDSLKPTSLVVWAVVASALAILLMYEIEIIEIFLGLVSPTINLSQVVGENLLLPVAALEEIGKDGFTFIVMSKAPKFSFTLKEVVLQKVLVPRSKIHYMWVLCASPSVFSTST